MTTTVLDEITQALIDYPSSYVTITIRDVDYPGIAINSGEDVEFKFDIRNSGPMDVTDLQLLVEGLNGTLVKGNGAAAQYASSFTTGASWFPDLPAHRDEDEAPVLFPNGTGFWFRPTRVATTSRELVRVSVANWSGSWDHYFSNHTGSDPDANATYSNTVAVQ